MIRSLSLALLGLSLSGCGSGRTQQPVAPVKGTVTYNGRPLKHGTILFESPGKRTAVGEVRNGAIVGVRTYEDNDGAPVGEHRVAIQSLAEMSAIALAGPSNPGDTGKYNPAYMSGTSAIPEHYGNPATSGLTANVAPDGAPLKFELKE